MIIADVPKKAQPKKLKIDDEQEKRYHDKLAAKAAQIVKSANIVWGKFSLLGFPDTIIDFV